MQYYKFLWILNFPEKESPVGSASTGTKKSAPKNRRDSLESQSRREGRLVFISKECSISIIVYSCFQQSISSSRLFTPTPSTSVRQKLHRHAFCSCRVYLSLKVNLEIVSFSDSCQVPGSGGTRKKSEDFR